MRRSQPDGGRAPSLSPSQTIGPFFHDVVELTGSNDTTDGAAGGQRIRLEGRVLDGAGDFVDDALVEIWQPEAAGIDQAEGGNARHSGAAGFARSETANEGRFSFQAIKPPMAEDGAAPFVLVRIFGRGLLRSLVTRIYFEDHAHAEDPVLLSIDPKRRGTLIAELDDSTTPPTYRFDIHLQGDRETVFFDLRQPQP
ncbi:MAG: protocatechuate 3,4-dioxygenase subunit alpha [Gemmatimonadota bacterium]|nr:protocatechuate 3,4-dioxygenase subunit alpha [Gemmatimonadota bacterium]